MALADRYSFVFVNIIFMSCLSALTGATETIEGPSVRTASPIINGTIVTNGAAPWMAALVDNNESTRPQIESHSCGGTLIDPLWILTAAHCVYGQEPEDLKVIIGRENLDDSTGEVRHIAEIISYPAYENTSRSVDIALLRLTQASTRTPLQIASAIEEKGLEGQQLTVFGWGKIGGGDSRPDCELVFQDLMGNPEEFICDSYAYSAADHPSRLMSTQLTLVSTSECNARYREILTSWGRPPVNLAADEQPIPNELCAWDRANLTTPCYGDSGGPLIGTINGKKFVVGIVSHGVAPSCNTTNQIEFFTQVSKFSNFIAETKGRSLALSFDVFCPPAVAPTVSYTKQADGNTRVKISWAEVNSDVSGYRLYYTRLPRQGSVVGNLALAAPANEFSIALAPGLKFMVALQATSSRCDGPVSEPLLISVQ